MESNHYLRVDVVTDTICIGQRKNKKMRTKKNKYIIMVFTKQKWHFYSSNFSKKKKNEARGNERCHIVGFGNLLIDRVEKFKYSSSFYVAKKRCLPSLF